MKHALLGGLSTLLLPFTAHAATTSAGGYLMRGGYQPRSYMRVDADAGSTTSLATRSQVRRKPPASSMSRDIGQLDIIQQGAVTELVVVDGSVADKAALARGLRPGVAMVEIDAGRPGLPQLVEALRGYRGLAAIHVVSHAQAGALQLGSSLVDAEELHRDLGALAAVRDAVREGGDLLFYGCDLAADGKGHALLDIVRSGTGLDVAASDNLTSNDGLGGDWTLEIQRGDIEAGLAFSARALRDFSGVLAASNGLKNFSGFTDNGTSLVDTDFDATARSGMGATLNIGKFVLDNSLAYAPSGWSDAGNYFYVKADGVNTTQFELTALTAGEAPGYSVYGIALTNVRVVGIRADGGTITSSAINGTTGVDDTFGFSLASFAGVKLKGFKLYFDCEGGCNAPVDEAAYMEFRNFTVVNAVASPSVSDARITISGASGTGGAYRIGDTVAATWNNTAGGDNNAAVNGVTVDFSQFGGGAAVAAANSSGTWTASHTITAGTIDTAPRNVSVTATSPGGSTTTADTTNATVDNIAPLVTDAHISISGASGTSGAFRIGDTVTATWNSTPGGDNNTDTISSATVNFSQFGGGAAVGATNSAGTWTATYTIAASVIDASSQNVAITAIDNAGNATTASDTTDATVDGTAPSVSSIAVSGSPASGDASMAFTVAFSEPVVNVSTDDFALASTGSATGTIASVSAASGTSIDVNITGITGTGTIKVNFGGTDVSDDAGNTVAAYTSGSSHTVAILTAPAAPTIGTATAGDGQAAVTFTAPGSNGGSAITTYTATASPGGASGTCAGPAACTATVTGLANGTAYTFTVTATNAIGISLASGASNSVTPKGSQTITFGNPGTQNFGTTPTLSATATSSLTPTFSSSTTGVCTITSGGALTFVTAGSCTIDADQAGNAAWNAAPTQTETFTVDAVAPGAPTIGTATAGDTQATVTFAAPAFTGGAAIIASGYTVTASPGGATATGSNSPITVTGLTNGQAYTFTVTAKNSAGEGTASAASNSVTPAAPQSITFANPGTQNFGTTPTLTASSSAGGGYPVSFTSSTTGVCTITAGGTLTFVNAGSCTINADQAGDSSFLAAPQASQVFIVAAVVPGAPTAAMASAGDTQASVAFNAPVFIGGTAITGYTVTVSPADVAPVSGASSPIVITGLTNGQPYTFTVTATNSAGTGSASAASNSITPAATQTITFAAPGEQNFGTTPTLTATADSGLTPTFTSSTTGVCTITSGGALTFVTIGNCTINADQAGNGSYLAAPQVTRTFMVNAVAPGAPTIGTATATGAGAASITFSAPAFTGGTGITGYTVTASPGGATGSGAGSPIAVGGLDPGTAYTFTVQAINPTGTGSPSAASNSVTPAPGLIAGAVSATVGYGSSSTTITLDITGSATSVAVPSPPAQGTVSVSGTSISYTPATGYAGADSFTYTASDAYSTTAPAMVSLTVSPPVLALSPGAGALPPGTADASYTQSFVASGGAAGYTYAVTGTPPSGLTVSASGVLSGTPTTPGTFNFTITATDNSTGDGPFTVSAAYSVQINAPGLAAGAVSATVGYGASATPVVLDITGAATSVAVASAPAHGTVSVSGTSISYTPAAGYAGADSFTYTASDAFSTTAPATVSVTVSAPSVAITTATLADATAGSAYTQTLATSGGTAPYRYAVTAGTLPTGLSLSATGELSGTPSQAGTFNVTVTATDSSTGAGPFSGSQAYTLQVDAPAIVLDPAALPAASGASPYQHVLTASGGAAPYQFTVVDGELPAGLALAASGTLSGEPSAAGTYEFTVQATDAHGFTGSHAYTLTVETVAQVIEAFVATPAEPVYAQGGTFTVAASGGASGNAVVFASSTAAVCQVQGTTVTMLSAGLCSLTADQAGDAIYQAAAQVQLDVTISAATPVLEWLVDLSKVYGQDDFDLPDPQSVSTGAFTFASSNPAVATVSGRTVHLVGEGAAMLVATQAASGSYTAASVEVQLLVSSRPDPTTDSQVSGGLQAQVDASVRFAQVQQANIRDRLRQVRGGHNASSTNLTLAYAGSDRMPGMSVPVGQAAQGAIPALPQGWGVWLAGTATFGQAGRNGSAGGAFDFNTGGITLGADRAVGEHVLLGMAGSWGRQGSDFDDTPSQVDADQTSLAVYGLWRAGEHLFLDGMLATGRLDFELARWSEVAGATARADRSGDQWFGSLTFGYEHRSTRGMTLTGYGRYDGHRSDLEAYREHGLGIFDLAYGDQRVDNSALAVGLEGNHAFQGDRTSWRPFWSVEYRKALENQGDASLNYVQRPLSSDYILAMRSYNDDMFALGVGVELQLDSGWMFSMLLGHEQGRNQMRSNSIGLQVRFGAQSGPSPVYVDDDRLGYRDPAEQGCGGRARGCRTRGIQP